MCVCVVSLSQDHCADGMTPKELFWLAQSPVDMATSLEEVIMAEIYEHGLVAALFYLCESFKTFLCASNPPPIIMPDLPCVGPVCHLLTPA